jgi:Ca2+:H+ antiporter
MSEFLVGAVEAARATLGLTEVFVGVIVIAVIGNAAEHSTAVLMAMKNKMGLSLGIARFSRNTCRPLPMVRKRLQKFRL